MNGEVDVVSLDKYELYISHLLQQNLFHIEHTIPGYLYLTGQILTTLANCYFFFIGVRFFPGVFHENLVGLITTLLEVLLHYDLSKPSCESPDQRHEEKTPESADAADRWIL